MDEQALRAWLRLGLVPGIGPVTAHKLLRSFGLPQAVFEQRPQTLREVVSDTQALALTQTPPELDAQVERTMAWLQASEAHRVLTLADADYPASLLQLPDPPLLLYLMGNGDLGTMAARAIAVVGSRNPTPQGLVNARQFARHLAQAGLCVVSGLALGIDGAAHEGALACEDRRGITLAVVGTGLDRVYPRAHHELAHRIAQAGLLLSEFALGAGPLAAHFPRRNRLIAGLSQGTLVVEAALQSGSLITARQAAEQGKDVFAIPGSIHAPQSRGCHALIQQGAQLVESAQDIVDSWAPLPASPAPLAAPVGTEGGPPDGLLHALGFDPVTLDVLVARTDWRASALQAALLTLELQGEVARLPGALYQRLRR